VKIAIHQATSPSSATTTASPGRCTGQRSLRTTARSNHGSPPCLCESVPATRSAGRARWRSSGSRSSHKDIGWRIGATRRGPATPTKARCWDYRPNQFRAVAITAGLFGADGLRAQGHVGEPDRNRATMPTPTWVILRGHLYLWESDRLEFRHGEEPGADVIEVGLDGCAASRLLNVNGLPAHTPAGVTSSNQDRAEQNQGIWVAAHGPAVA
jgi:hypothetical protein